MFTVGVKAQKLTSVIAFGKQCTSRFADAAKYPARSGTLSDFHGFISSFGLFMRIFLLQRKV
jgi:hypothetical protein